jgi:hypothetical protein
MDNGKVKFAGLPRNVIDRELSPGPGAGFDDRDLIGMINEFLNDMQSGRNVPVIVQGEPRAVRIRCDDLDDVWVDRGALARTRTKAGTRTKGGNRQARRRQPPRLKTVTGAAPPLITAFNHRNIWRPQFAPPDFAPVQPDAGKFSRQYYRYKIRTGRHWVCTSRSDRDETTCTTVFSGHVQKQEFD